MSAHIVLLPGDGIGPEVMAVAKRIVDAAASLADLKIQCSTELIGGAAIDATGVPLPETSATACRQADAVLLGAVGGPQWHAQEIAKRPEGGLLQLRALLGTFANLRPVKPHAATIDASPLKPALLHNVDIMVVRELTGGIYFGDKTEGDTHAADVCEYTADEIARTVRVAGRLARQRDGKVTSVDKSNVLATSRLWRRVCNEVIADEFPDVTLEHLLVDAAAMHLLSRPAQFDVLVTENMFGDILTDEASMLAGSMGLLPSASLGEQRTEHGLVGLYEPIHGSAPDIAGQGIANPCGMIASVAMMFRYSFGAANLAASIESAIAAALNDGIATPDLGGTNTTAQMGEAIVSHLV
ncbi:MAG: 3-isopropylmalate dehydrogenase [Pseudomonadota bacterium]